MNKKILIILILIIIIVAAALGYFFFYQKSEEPQVNLGNQKPASGNEECGKLVNRIIDGAIQQIDNDSIAVQLKGEKGAIETIKLTEATEFREIALSEQMEIVSQKEIESADLEKGDQVSVVALCDEARPEIKRALVVRRMVVQ
jgi:hypothetical protein